MMDKILLCEEKHEVMSVFPLVGLFFLYLSVILIENFTYSMYLNKQQICLS